MGVAASASVFVQPWRATQSMVSDRVIFGPYPVEDDFVALKQRGVSTIISLLDPAIPYEKVLLAQERERAARHGMVVRNFPMASILGQSFGADYMKNSKAAAEAALAAEGTAYIHCYLGLHRAKNVEKYLAQSHATASYEGSVATARPADTQALDRANFAFMDGDYDTALAELATIRQPGAPALQLAGWSHYRKGEIPQARERFSRALALDGDDLESRSGLAYCALREGDPAGAETGFAAILAQRPDDPAAIEGLAHALHRQGRDEEARTWFTRALALNPDNPETRGMLDRLQPSSPAAAPSAGAAAD
jgi:Flp pilus assembly protein TadD